MKLLKDVAGCTQTKSPSSYVLGTCLKHKQTFMSAQSLPPNIQREPVCPYVKRNVITINSKPTDVWDISMSYGKLYKLFG